MKRYRRRNVMITMATQALNLGYQRIVKDKRLNISIDDKQYPDDVMISISMMVSYPRYATRHQNDLARMIWTALMRMVMKI